VSVTSASISRDNIKIRYVDVKESKTVERDFPIINASVKA